MMGGGETYRKALPTADILFITHVHAVIKDADTFFPAIDPRSGRLIQDADRHRSETGYTYEFRVYTRRVFPPLCL